MEIKTVSSVSGEHGACLTLLSLHSHPLGGRSAQEPGKMQRKGLPQISGPRSEARLLIALGK